jgi:hypothetical protein
VRTDREVFGEVADWWDDQPVVVGNPFLRTAMLGCWEDGFDEPNSRLNVVLLHRNDELVAGLPLYRARGRLRSLDQEHLQSFDVVASPDYEVQREIPRWLDRLGVTHLYRVRKESPIVAAMPTRPSWHLQRVLHGPFIDLHQGFESVQAASRRRSTRGRHRRRLSEMGEVTFHDHAARGDIDAALDEGFQLEAAGWKGREGVSTLDSPGYQRWFKSVAEIAESHGWLRLSSLRLGDRLLAFQFDLVFGSTRYLLITCYDEGPDVAGFSPGSLLIESVLEYSAGQGLTRYELGNGRNAWKSDWTSDEREVYDLLIFGSGVKGRALSLAARLRRRVSRRRSVEAGLDNATD